jgi:hypothetical protein
VVDDVLVPPCVGDVATVVAASLLVWRDQAGSDGFAVELGKPAGRRARRVRRAQGEGEQPLVGAPARRRDRPVATVCLHRPATDAAQGATGQIQQVASRPAVGRALVVDGHGALRHQRRAGVGSQRPIVAQPSAGQPVLPGRLAGELEALLRLGSADRGGRLRRRVGGGRRVGRGGARRQEQGGADQQPASRLGSGRRHPTSSSHINEDGHQNRSVHLARSSRNLLALLPGVP